VTEAERLTAYEHGRWSSVFAPRARGEKRYWVVKSEPGEFSFDDLRRAPGKTTHWDGVRNAVARNFLRDGMKIGDEVFFYHSNAQPPAIVGIAEVVREGYPDPTALDPQHGHHDPKSDPRSPTWFMVDLRAVRELARPVTLPEIKKRKELAEMALVRIGRLSVSPVTKREWQLILELGE
jgi:predicted RNA-binding protein with PUA-like domain